MSIYSNEGLPNGDAGAVKARGRPKARPDEVQRDLIVKAARAIFLASGYARTTMDAVAAACGMSKRTLYRLFPTKIDLLKAMVVDHRRSMLALPRDDDNDPIDDALAAIFRLDIGQEESDERTTFIRFALAEGVRYPEIIEVLVADGAAATHAMLAHWLERQTAQGRLVIDKPSTAARMLMDMIFGVFVRRFPEDGILTHRDRLAHARDCIGIFLDGARAAARPSQGGDRHGNPVGN